MWKNYILLCKKLLTFIFWFACLSSALCCIRIYAVYGNAGSTANLSVLRVDITRSEVPIALISAILTKNSYLTLFLMSTRIMGI